MLTFAPYDTKTDIATQGCDLRLEHATVCNIVLNAERCTLGFIRRTRSENDAQDP